MKGILRNVCGLVLSSVFLAAVFIVTAGGALSPCPAAAAAVRTVVFSPQPGPVQVVGETWAFFSVQVLNTSGQPDTADSRTKITLSLASGATGKLSGTLSKTVSKGVASFTNISYNKAETISLVAKTSDRKIAAVTSTPVTVGSSSLTFQTQPPANQTSGQAWAPFSVAVVLNGNVSTGDNTTVVTLSGPAGLAGTLTRTVAAGVAIFNDVSYTMTAPGTATFPLTATASVPTITGAVSNPITVTAAASLAFSAQPASPQRAGRTWTPFTVGVLFGGNVVTTDNTTQVTISGPAGLAGTLTKTVSAGVATFDGVLFNPTTPGATTISLTATAPGSTAATSDPVTVVTPGLAFGTQPGSPQRVGRVWTPFTVTVVYDGIVDTQDNSTSVTIAAAPGASLQPTGTLSAVAVNGVATFSNVSYAAAETIALVASASNAVMTAATSNPVAVATPQLAFSPQPGPTGRLGKPLAPFAVQVLLNGVVDTRDNTTQIKLTPDGLTYWYTKTVSAGVALFDNVSFGYISTNPSTYTFTASTAGMASVTSSPVTIYGPAIAFAPAPATTQNVGVVWQPFSVKLTYNGVVDTTDNTTQVTISCGSYGILHGTLKKTMSAGIATFDDVWYDMATNMTISASASSAASISTPYIYVYASRKISYYTPTRTTERVGQVWAPAKFSVGPSYSPDPNDNTTVVTVALYPGTPGTLSGTLTKKVTAGVVTFDDLSYDRTGWPQLHATATQNVAASNYAYITVLAPSLAFSPQPNASQEQGIVWTPFTVKAMFNGAVDTQDNSTLVTIRPSTGATGVLSGTVSRTLSAGVVTFDDITYSAVETITLAASSSDPTMTGATSTAVVVSPRQKKLAFDVQPPSTAVQGAVWPPFTVRLISGGAVVTDDNTTRVTIADNSCPGALQGTLTKTVTAGVATFDDVFSVVTGSVDVDAAADDPAVLPGSSSAVSVSPRLTVGEVLPTNGRTKVALRSPVSATFSVPLDPTSVTTDTFQVNGPSGRVAGTFTFSADATSCTFWPAAAMSPSSQHSAALTTGIRDARGYALETQFSLYFTTEAAGWSLPVNLNMGLTYNGNEPGIAMSGSGNVFASWTESTTIYVSNYQMWEGSWWTRSIPGAPFQHPRVTTDWDNGAIGVYRASNGTSAWIGASTYDQSTNLWSSDVAIAPVSTIFDVTPAIDMNRTGEAVAVWQTYDETLGGYGVFASRYSPDIGWLPSEPVSGTLSAPIDQPVQVAMNDAGEIVAAWNQTVFAGGPLELVVRRYDPSTGWTGTMAAPYGSTIVPQVGIDASGNVLAVWADSASSIRWSRLLPGDTSWPAANQLWTPLGATSLALAVGDDGDATLGVSEYPSSEGVSLVDLYSFENGAWSTTSRFLGLAPNSFDQVKVARDGSGRAIVVYREYGSVPGYYAVYALRYEKTTGWETFPYRLTAPAANGDANEPQVALDDYGNPAVVWRQWTFTGYGTPGSYFLIYGARYVAGP